MPHALSSADQNAYFDEVYFMEGHKKGTVYCNYIEAARSSGIFRGIAEAIVKVFQPRRCLEIGCATGIVIKHINDLGCEGHGIDVSAWAVDNREHPNVQQAGAEALPFPDGHFDLVFSCHSLEHIPADHKDVALLEMTRVCAPLGSQFHMLPILGMGPYIGERQAVINGLRSDPTHHLLMDKAEWLDEWGRFGWRDTGVRLALLDDTPSYELTKSQFILSRAPRLPACVDQSLIDHNLIVARELHRRASGRVPTFHSPGFAMSEGCAIEFPSEPIWRSVETYPDPALDLTQGPIGLVVELLGSVPDFRIAAGSGANDPWSDCAHLAFPLHRGLNSFALHAGDLVRLRGAPDLRAVRCISLGGTGDGAATLRFWCMLPGASR